MSTFINSALASAHKALSDSDKSSVGTKSGHSNFGPHKTVGAPTYDQPHQMRKTGSFMGVGSDQSSELKAADTAHDNNVKALNQE